jgi:hypothetical protein
MKLKLLAWITLFGFSFSSETSNTKSAWFSLHTYLLYCLHIYHKIIKSLIFLFSIFLIKKKKWKKNFIFFFFNFLFFFIFFFFFSFSFVFSLNSVYLIILWWDQNGIINCILQYVYSSLSITSHALHPNHIRYTYSSLHKYILRMI